MVSHIKRQHPEYDEAAIGQEDLEPNSDADPEYVPDLEIPMSPELLGSPPPLTSRRVPIPKAVDAYDVPATYPPPKPKPKGRRSYYKGGRRGRGRGRGRGQTRGAAAGGGGGTGGKSLQYLHKSFERKVGRKAAAAASDMPEIGMSLDGIPELMAGGPINRDDKKKIRRLLKIKEARIKYQQKACCARSICYQDHMAMKALDSSTNFSPIANFELNGEPSMKRRRLSSTASSASGVPAYMQQSSYQSTYSPYEPSVRLPTQIPEAYDNLPYPFLDHCYFKMEGMSMPAYGDESVASTSAGTSSAASRRKQQLQVNDSDGAADGMRDVGGNRSMMRGVYKPTAWGSSNMRSYAEEIDMGEFDVQTPPPPTPDPSREFGSFPSTSFVPPPPPPSRTITTPRRKRGRKVGSGRKPYGSGKFVPLTPGSQFDISTGLQDSHVNVITQNTDTVPLDQFSMDGEVAVQHEVGDVVPEMTEEIIGGPGDDLIKPPAAEELMEDIQQDSFLKDIISQLEQRTQQTGGVPQSPITTALMRTLMQSPPGQKISGRRLSLGSSSHSVAETSAQASSSSLFDLQEGQQTMDTTTTNAAGVPIGTDPEQSEDAMVTVVTNQVTPPTDSIASILPSQTATTTTTGVTPDIDEGTLNEVYQLLGSNFDNLEDLQNQIGQSPPGVGTSRGQQQPQATTPEVIYTAKSSAASTGLPSFAPSPGSTSRYRTMSRGVASAGSTGAVGSVGTTATITGVSSQSGQIIYQAGGVKQSKKLYQTQTVLQNPVQTSLIKGSGLSIDSEAKTTDHISLFDASSSTISDPGVSLVSTTSTLSAAAAQNVSMPANSAAMVTIASAADTTLVSTTAGTATTSAAAGSGRIPVRIQLAPGSGTGSTPMRIKLPSGTSLGQNITRISLQQLLKSGASIQSSTNPSDSTGSTRIIRVPAGTLNSITSSSSGMLSSSLTAGTSIAGGARVLTIPASSASSASGALSTIKFSGKNVPITTISKSAAQGRSSLAPATSTGPRIVRLSRGGTLTNFQIQGGNVISTVEQGDATAVTAAATATTISSPAASDNLQAVSTIVDNSFVPETNEIPIQDELMDSLPTDEEIARNIQEAEGLEGVGDMGANMQL